ncbi:MAG: FG-GAP-like repeat-containing protein [Ignavibacteria bacterium]|jgi:hypothetical protein
MKRLSFTTLLLIIIFLIPANRVILSQQLVQSFIEGNISGGEQRFGRSLSSAGDVNGDGYDDVIVAAYEYKNSTGCAYIFYGGSSMDNTGDVIITGESEGDYFGWSVSTAGDVNNDGKDDFIIGAYGHANNRGRVYIFFGDSSLSSSMNADDADVIIASENGSNSFGISVSHAGDVNGDNIDDVIVGASYYSSGTGRAYVFYGGSLSSGIDADSADVIVEPSSYGNSFGCSVSSAGDVNGDNIDDVIVGAEGYSGYTGRAYIFYGGSNMDNTADVTITGGSSEFYFGHSVSYAGNVNNDSYDDVIVGAYGYDHNRGRAFIFYGGSSLSGSYPASSADVIISGENRDDYFGCSVSSAGDVNGDNIDDVIVGAEGYSNYTGRAYIFYGGSSMDDTADVIITGRSTYYYFGHSVSYAGNINNDNYDDVIIGEYKYYYERGRAYIFYGSNSLSGNFDASSANVTITGENDGDHFGWSVSYAGDVNGDNIDDVIVGAPEYNYENGRAYIFYGGSSIYTADVKITGINTSNQFGYSVSYAGNINNDSYDDFIVGTIGYYAPGRAYIFHGSSSLSSSISSSSANIVITGENGDDKFGNSVSYAGDVNNDGYDDIIIGAPNYPLNGQTYIYSDNNAPMPVELTSFTARFDKLNDQQNCVVLNWQTATEVNNYGFEIERNTPLQSPLEGGMSETRGVWETLAFINGHGNSNSPKSYNFTDKTVTEGKYQYRLKQIDFDGSFEFSNTVEISFINSQTLPAEFELFQNYPNPFNPTTAIQYSMPETGLVSLRIYNLLGQEVKTLVSKEQTAGVYNVQWNGENNVGQKVTSGIYIYRIESGKFVDSKKLVLLK